MNAPDWINMLAVERGQPDGWRWFRLESVGEADDAHRVVLVKGGVPGAVFKSGPRKGKTNWAKATHQAELAITAADVQARAERWEGETGNCHKCGGDGLEVCGVTLGTGERRTRPCPRCKGAGKVVRIPIPVEIEV